MTILVILGIILALLAYSAKIIFELSIFPTVVGFLFVFYILYYWIDFLFLKRNKKVYYEDPIFPRLKTGLQPTLTEMNLDMTEKFLKTDFDWKEPNDNSNDNSNDNN